MQHFDEYTKNILFEALSKPPKKGKIGIISSKSGGSGSGGPAIDKTKKARYNVAWSGTPEAPGTMMPPGADIPSQVRWGIGKQYVDKVIDSTLGKIPVFGGVVSFPVKQAIKQNLAYQYLGTTGGKSKSELDKELKNAGLDPADPDVVSAMSSLTGKLGPMGGLSSLTPSGGPGRFGVLGQKVAGKVGDLTLMGIDPLDWVTKAFGADAAAAHISNMPTAQIGVMSAGGYLGKGKQKGIY